MTTGCEARSNGTERRLRAVDAGVLRRNGNGLEMGRLDLAGLTFLVVDDEASILRMVASVLSGMSGRVLTAPDGAEAVELLRTHQPDILISDIRMPGMDGLSLLTHARSAAPETAVVLITGFADKDVVIEALRAGASSFLEKPFGVSSLLGHLKPLVERIQLKRENERLREEREREREQREEQGRLAAMGRVLAGLAREVLVPLDLACQGVEMARYEVARLERGEGSSGDGHPDEWLAEVGRCVHSVQEKVLTIEQFLDPSRPRRPVAAAVSDAVSRALSTAQGGRPESIAVRTDVEEGLEVVCDTLDLDTCLSRVVSNAYEALSRKGSQLTISARRTTKGFPGVEVRVTDDGPGMAPDLLARVLVPFFSTRPDAMGFGLPIAFEAVRRNGGALAVESAEGKGTAVILRLPTTGSGGCALGA